MAALVIGGMQNPCLPPDQLEGCFNLPISHLIYRFDRIKELNEPAEQPKVKEVNLLDD